MNNKTSLPILLILVILATLIPAIMAQGETSTQYKLELLWISEYRDTEVWDLDWSPDGKYIVVGTDNGYLKIYDADTGRYLRGIKLGGEVRFVDWSQDGKCIATINHDRKEIFVVDADTYRIVWSKQLDSEICGIVWDPLGKYLAVGTKDYLYLFNKNGKQLWRAKKHPDTRICNIAWSHDGDRIAFIRGAVRNYVIVYDRDGKKLWEYKINATINTSFISVDWSPDGKFLAVGSGVRHVYVFSENGVLVWSRALGGGVFNVAWDPGGEYLAVSGYFGTALFTKTGKQLWKKIYIVAGPSIQGHDNLDWSKNGLLAVGGKRLYILDRDGNTLTRSKHLRHWTRRIAWSPDRTRIAAVVGVNKLYVWKLFTNAIVWVEASGAKIQVCFSGPESFCDIITGAGREYNLAPGTYTVELKLLEVPGNVVGDISNYKIIKTYTLELGKKYQAPGLTDLLGVVQFVNDLSFGVDVTVSWNSSRKVFSLSRSDSLTLYAVPGRYGVTVSPRDIGGDVVGDTSYLGKTLDVDVHVGGSPVVVRLSDILSEFAELVFENPLMLPIDVNISWVSAQKVFRINPNERISLYAAPGQYNIRWSIEGAIGYDDKLGGASTVIINGSKTYVFRISNGVGVLRIVNSLDLPYLICIEWSNDSKEYIIGSYGSLEIYVAPGEYRVYATPNYRFLVDKYVGSKTINVEAGSTEEIDLSNVVPVSKIIIRGMPGARYVVSSGNIIVEGMLSEKGEEALFMPSGMISIHVEPLDILYVPIEGFINAEPGKVILVDVSKYPYGLFFYIFLGLVACGLCGGFYVAVMKPRLSIEVSRREIIRGVDEKIRIKLSNKGLISGEFSVVIDVNGQRVYEDRIRLKGREIRWIDVDLGSLVKRLMEESKNE